MPLLKYLKFVVLPFLLILADVRFAPAFTTNDADAIITSYNDAFYFTANGKGYFKNTTEGGKTWFWMRAEEMEMILDVYERSSNSVYLTMFTNLFNGFVADFGTNWMWNEFNDDIMWMVIGSARAYQLSGNIAFKNAAKSNFDACFARAWSADLGGGLWWKTNNTSKNACVNGPASIAAYLLYQIYADTNYLTKAKDIYLWERATLFNPTNGQVYDNINSLETKAQKAYTYNQGTFIGAANFLGHTNDAALAADYTRTNLASGGILPPYGERGDGGGFNGIFLRWMAKFMKSRGLQSSYQSWLQSNADAAWNIRRKSDNLSWCKWHQPTPEGTRYSFGCSSSVVALQVVPPSQTGATNTAK